jgi:hypothetical protein
MRRSPSMVPSEANQDTYLVLDDFGGRLGRAWRESAEEDANHETLIRDFRYIGKESKTTQITLVSTISASIGAYLGMAATVIGPFVTLGLMALLQVGRNAWCAG